MHVVQPSSHRKIAMRASACELNDAGRAAPSQGREEAFGHGVVEAITDEPIDGITPISSALAEPVACVQEAVMLLCTTVPSTLSEPVFTAVPEVGEADAARCTSRRSARPESSNRQYSPSHGIR